MNMRTVPALNQFHAIDGEVFVTNDQDYIKCGYNAYFVKICDAANDAEALQLSQLLNSSRSVWYE